MPDEIAFNTDESYVLEIAAMQQLVSRTITNIFHIAVKNDYSANAAATEAASIMTRAWGDLAAHLSKSWRLVGYTYRVANFPNHQNVDVSLSEHVVGASSSALLPRRSTGIVAFKTGKQKPRGSRKFLSGFTEAGNEREGQPTVGVVQGMQAWGDHFITHNTDPDPSGGNGEDLNFIFCSVSRGEVPFQQFPDTENLDGSVNLVTHWEPWLSAIARNQWKSLRRRG